MAFPRLNRSITNNEDKEPTLYMTLCMVESLFEDVEHVSGMDLSQCPIGNELLPNKLIWLSNAILDIYDENRGQLERNQVLLKSTIDNLQSTREKLEQLADLEKQLPEKEAEYQQLLRQLEAAKAAQDTLAKLLRQIEDAQKELAALESFDMDGARRQLAELQTKIRDLKQEINDLETQTQSLKKSIQTLENDITVLKKELEQNLRPEQDRLTKRKLELEEEKRLLQQQIGDLANETDNLTAELARLRAELPRRIQERDDAKQRVDDYRRTQYDPVVTERDKHLETEKQLQTNKSEVEKQITDLIESKRDLTREIARMSEQYDRDTRDLESKKTQEQELIRKQAELTTKLNDATDALDLRQAEYNKLEKETLPDAEKHLADATSRRDELQTKIDGINTQRTNTNSKIQQLNSELPQRKEELRKCQEELENLQKVHDGLTVSFKDNSSDIVELEKKIAELKEKNNQERLDIHRNQLTSEKERLEKQAEELKNECAQLDKDIQELTEQLEAGTQKCESLKNRKQTQEEGQKGIERLLAELRPYDNEEYRLKTEKTQTRLKTLQTVRENLAYTISLASQHFAGGSLKTVEMNVQQIGTSLSLAVDYTNKIYRDLHDCSKTLNTYIKEEPK